MKTYTLHVPAGAVPHDPAALERAVLVRDGFSIGAFLFTALWFFAHRLWLAGLGVTLALGAFLLAMGFLGTAPGAAALALAVVALLIGLEAESLRRWTLARNGRPAVDVVAARHLEDAETKLFSRWLEGAEPKALPSSPPRAPLPPLASRSPNQPVLGLFPEADPAR